MAKRPLSAYVIGSGPNGLTAAIELARAGVQTTVLEAQPTIGGGTRCATLTLPGFTHDLCSAVHPLAVSSPAFLSMPLREHGLEWIQPPAALAHPLDGGRAVMLERSLGETAAKLGHDSGAWQSWMAPYTTQWHRLVQDILAPIHVPHDPLLFARFGIAAIWPASMVAKALFKTTEARALFAGIAAHSILPLSSMGSAAFGWVLGAAGHAVGWPIPKGGSQKIADALVSYLQSLGGTVSANSPVTSFQMLKERDIVIADISPRQLLQMGGDLLPTAYTRKLESYQYGPGVFKMDWALNGPIPWSSSDCARAATVHLGGTLEEIAASEKAPWHGEGPTSPFVLVAQPSLFDRTRAPAGQHTAWAYCHVPNGWKGDASTFIENQIERFARGFRTRILARHAMGPAALEKHNANLIGGDIGGGAVTLGQLFFRPTRQLYRTPRRGLYLCSASTPPGGGVHGMAGYHAAHTALQDFAL